MFFKKIKTIKIAYNQKSPNSNVNEALGRHKEGNEHVGVTEVHVETFVTSLVFEPDLEV